MNDEIEFRVIDRKPKTTDPSGFYKIIDLEGRFWGRFLVTKNRTGEVAVLAVNECGFPY